MKVAIEGCAHGELDKIYTAVRKVQEKHNITVDLLICCGDFQCVRDKEDLENLSCPPQFRHMKDFYKYYTGEKVAPVTTIFIGGNNEVPSFLRELSNGGWVAPNIYYLGTAGVLRVGPLRIAGMSGSFRPQDFFTAHHECPPYTDATRRSANNVREWDVARLARVTEPIDIVVSHDWPRGIWKHGNCAEMLDHRDPSGDLRREMDANQVGSLAAMDLLKKLRPGFWFSAHLHTKFAALVPHEDGTFTRFLALDQCRPRKDFLQVVDIDPRSPSFVHRMPAADSRSTGGWANRWKDKQSTSALGPSARLDYDPEWLAIQKVNHPHLSFSVRNQKATVVAPTKEDIAWVVRRLRDNVTPMPRKRATTRRHSSLLPTKLREACGEKSFKDLTTGQLRELFETRGLEFPGHLDKASLTRQLEEHDEFFAAERLIEQTAADEAFPVPENFSPEKENAAAQRCSLLKILELVDSWKEQEEERRERMAPPSGYDPVSEALTSEMDKELPPSAAEPSADDDCAVVSPAEMDGAESAVSSPLVVSGSPAAESGDENNLQASRVSENLAATVAAESPGEIKADASNEFEAVTAVAPVEEEVAMPEAAAEEDSIVADEAAAAAEVAAAEEGDDPMVADEAAAAEVSPAEEGDNPMVADEAAASEVAASEEGDDCMVADEVAESASMEGYEEMLNGGEVQGQMLASDEDAALAEDADEASALGELAGTDDAGLAEFADASAPVAEEDAFAAFVEASDAFEELELGVDEPMGDADGVEASMALPEEAAQPALEEFAEDDDEIAGLETALADHAVESEIAAMENALAELQETAEAVEEVEVEDEIAALEDTLAELEATDAILQEDDLDEEAEEEAGIAFDPYAQEEPELELDPEPPAKVPRLG